MVGLGGGGGGGEGDHPVVVSCWRVVVTERLQRKGLRVRVPPLTVASEARHAAGRRHVPTHDDLDDDAECAAAAAAQRPPEVGQRRVGGHRGLADLDERAIGQHKLGRDDVVDTEAVLPDQGAMAAAQREADRPDGAAHAPDGLVAGRVYLCVKSVEVRSRAKGDGVDRVVLDDGTEPRDVEVERVLRQAVTTVAVARRFDAEDEVVRGRELDC